jgi:hypothetical protein
MLVPRIDTNKDSYVDEDELVIWIRHKLQPWTVHEDIDAIYHDIDINYDNQITWDEYMENVFGFRESGEYCFEVESQLYKAKTWGSRTYACCTAFEMKLL